MLLIFAPQLTSPTLLARQMRPEVNARESCRRELTGAYINAYDAKERQRHLVRALKEKISENQKALVKSKAEYEKRKEKKSQSSFDASLAELLKEALSALQTFEDQQKILQEELVKAQIEEVEAIKLEKALRLQLEPFMAFKRFEDRPDGGYPIEGQFKSPCPPFRSLCPLPTKDLELLSAVRVEGELPESCRRYLSLGRTPKPTSP